MENTDVLVFVEDPGAVNFVNQLPAALAERNLTTRMCAQATASKSLAAQKVAHIDVPAQTSAEAILRQYSPRLCVVGTAENPDTLGLKLVDACHQLRIPTVGVVDAQANAEYRFRGKSPDPLAHAPDWILTPDQPTRDEFRGLGFPGDRVAAVGHPQYDHVRRLAAEFTGRDRLATRARLYPKAPAHCPIVVFLSEVSTGCDPTEFRRSDAYTLHGSGKYDGRTQIVLEEFLRARNSLPSTPYLVLRLHPKNTRIELSPLIDEFEEVSQHGCPLELIYFADAVVGMTTMLLCEAALMGTPTLSIVPRSIESSWLASVSWGWTRVASTREHLAEELSSLLQQTTETRPPNKGNGVPANSLGRLTDFLNNLLN